MIRTGDWIQTYTGKVFYPLDPRPEEIDIIDIAHALSTTNRFGGHAEPPVSVAEHSVNVSMYVPRHAAIEGLMHDAAEAYIGDVTRPIKPALNGFKAIESKIMRVISEKYGLNEKYLHGVVKHIDDRVLATEGRQVMVWPPPKDWLLETEPIVGLKVECLPWYMAKVLFLKRFYELKEQSK